MDDRRRATWLRDVLRWALAAFMGIAGVGHLVATDSFLGQVPDFLPFRTAIVLGSGVIELGFAAALVLTRGERRRQTGWALAAFYVLIFPGNLYQAIAGTTAFGLDTPFARWARLLFQPVLIVWALWSTGAWPHHPYEDRLNRPRTSRSSSSGARRSGRSTSRDRAVPPGT